jgi:hypothetical protein
MNIGVYLATQNGRSSLAHKNVVKKPSVNEKPSVQQVAVDKAVLADVRINQALANGQIVLAQQELSALDASAPETLALKLKVDTYMQRGVILQRIIQERRPKLRVQHPTTGEQWDVVGVIEGGLAISSAAGSKTDLTWNQVSMKDTARIFAEAAAHPQGKADEHAAATIMNIIADDAVMASVAQKRGKATYDPVLAKELEQLILFARQRDVLELAAVGKNAAATGNMKLVQDTIEQIRKLDPALQALVAHDLATLDQAKVAPATTAAATSSGAELAKDRLLFDANDELKLFSEKSGTWVVANGMVGNSSVPARLLRKDLDDARAAQLMFMPMSNKGQMTVDFRGVRFVIDFMSSTYQVITREETLPTKKFAFLPKTVCSLYFNLNQPGNTVSVLINNGADSATIKAGDSLSPAFSIQCDSANIAVDELHVLRGRVATSKVKQEELRKLGLEPMGEAFLEAPAIILPPARGGPTSGVALVLRDNMAGVTCDVKGDGMLRIQIGNPNDRSGTWLDVPVGVVPMQYKISIAGGKLTISDSSGKEVASQKLTGKHTHLMLIAMKEATLLATPRLIFQ